MLWRFALITAILILFITPANAENSVSLIDWPTASIIATIFFGILAVLWKILPDKKTTNTINVDKTNKQLEDELTGLKNEIVDIKNLIHKNTKDLEQNKNNYKDCYDRLQANIDHLESRVDKILNFFVEHIQRKGWNSDSE